MTVPDQHSISFTTENGQGKTIGRQIVFREHLYARYKLEDTRHLWVGGDGAKWVSSTFDHSGVKNVTRILDSHYVQQFSI